MRKIFINYSFFVLLTLIFTGCSSTGSYTSRAVNDDIYVLGGI